MNSDSFNTIQRGKRRKTENEAENCAGGGTARMVNIQFIIKLQKRKSPCTKFVQGLYLLGGLLYLLEEIIH